MSDFGLTTVHRTTSDNMCISRMAGHTILAATYGLNPKREDAYFHTVFMAVQGLNLGLSRRALVYDFFPPSK